MSKQSSIILAVVALFVGLTIGAWSVGAIDRRSADRLTMSQWTAEAAMRLRVLRHLRADNTTNEVAVLEAQLDGCLIGLGFYPPSELKRDPFCIKTLEMARDYYSQFPHHSSSRYVEELIAKDLDLFDALTGHQNVQ